MGKEEIKIISIQHGATSNGVEGAENMTLPEVCKTLDIRHEGSAFFVNGERVSQAEAATKVVRGGDEVRIAPKGDGGW